MINGRSVVFMRRYISVKMLKFIHCRRYVTRNTTLPIIVVVIVIVVIIAVILAAQSNIITAPFVFCRLRSNCW
jgi:hypothetical protein